MRSCLAENVELLLMLSQSRNNEEKMKAVNELYRTFIIERGLSRAFIVWRARRDGMDEELVKALEGETASADT